MRFLVLSLFLQVATAQPAILRTFEDDKVGAVPSNFTVAAGRDATADGWAVKREGTGQVLAHAGSKSSPDGFSVAVLTQRGFQAARSSVRLKTSGGRTAGLVWKYQIH